MLRKPTSSSIAAFLLLQASWSPAGVLSVDRTSMSVSLVIQKSCVIHSVADPSSVATPRVTCEHGEPYSVAFVPLEPTQPLSTMQFTAPGTRQLVWMVSF
jgi:hypothetical protein